MPTRHARLCRRLAALAVPAAVAACGGGGGSSGGTPSNATIKSVSANGAVMPNDSTEAASVALKTAQAVVAAGPASATVSFACPGGGTARYTVTGPAGTIANSVLDTAEVFSFSFAACKSAPTAPAVSGAMTLTVNSQSAATLAVSTSTTNLSVALADRTITLNGSSTLTQTTTTSGGNTTTSNHWQSPSIKVTSRRGSTDSFFDLNSVNYTRNNIIAINGTPVGSSCEGGSTLNADLAFFTWFITLATLGPISYGPTGAVVSGAWLIDLPDDRIRLEFTPFSFSVAVDLGANGTNDLVFFIDFTEFYGEAG